MKAPLPEECRWEALRRPEEASKEHGPYFSDLDFISKFGKLKLVKSAKVNIKRHLRELTPGESADVIDSVADLIVGFLKDRTQPIPSQKKMKTRPKPRVAKSTKKNISGGDR